MELSSEEGEIAIPINSSSSYGGGGQHGNGHGHMNTHHHNHNHNHNLNHNHSHNHHEHMISNSAAAAQNPSSKWSSMQGQGEDAAGAGGVVTIRYRECLKNHAAAMGGNATDGCGEFMPSGEEGTIEALNCSACHCHRNFHRKEVEGRRNKFQRLLAPPGLLSRSVVPPHQMIMPYSIAPVLPSESDEQEEGGGRVNKKRFRTKFTQEQKDKMLAFAEKAGWKIQKQEESVVQQFCHDIGVKRRVLKVWMHNNKHTLSKKNNTHHLLLPNPNPNPNHNHHNPPTTTTTTTTTASASASA